jgi:hypothetical protein
MFTLRAAAACAPLTLGRWVTISIEDWFAHPIELRESSFIVLGLEEFSSYTIVTVSIIVLFLICHVLP